MTYFCPDCFGDRSLRSALVRLRPKIEDGAKCNFHPRKKGIPGEAVAELVDRAIQGNYGLVDQNPYFEAGCDLQDLISDVTEAETDEIAVALKEALIDGDDADPRDGGEPFYDEQARYEPYEVSYNPLEEVWDRFKFEVMHRQRFFSDRSRNWLDEIFSDLHHQKDRSGRSPIYTVSPGERGWLLFRARRIDDPKAREEALTKPEVHLAPPPERLRRAGRLNSSGVCCFYGAFDVETCLAELRAPVGGHVVSAAFELIRPITILDTTRFSNEAQNRSIFSPVYQSRLDQWRFMQVFKEEIMKPILPDDEALDYVPTQAVAEFIHAHLGGKLGSNPLRIDGIVYGSAQRPEGKNIALFGEAALVQRADELEDEGGLTKAEEARFWGSSDTFLSPSMDAFVSPGPALNYAAGTANVHRITGIEVSWETALSRTNEDF